MDNVDLVRAMYAAFKRGAIQEVLACFSEDFDFKHPIPRAIWPWAGHRKGPKEFAEFIEESSKVIEREHFEVDQFIAQGDDVVVLLSERMRAKATGIAFDNPHVNVFKFKDGKIVQFIVVEDTAPIIAALQGYARQS